MSVVAASPASATTTTCAVSYYSCSTAILNAVSGKNFIKWEVDSGASGSGCSWQVIDVGNLHVVGSGRLGAFRHNNGQINGLYGNYRLDLWNCGLSAFGWINNQ
ncbi:hypothetical protein [Planotetraspora phitsanulokensis]|uniref:hypothetical protein n=1 Tax=Planotetraspora phitsanulokensis TaxID=575192 RepID=UPI001950E140|nr:hypothetical protein [Planotetraspora phitsanulokensis]